MKLPTLKVFKLPGAKKSPAPAPGQDTVQKWLPVRDVQSGLVVRQDGVPVAVVRVEPAPFSLLSDRERERRIAALFEAVQGLAGAAQVLSLARPLDLDAYIEDLEARLREADGARKAILRGYLSYVRGLAAAGSAVERRFYVLIPGEAGKKKGGREELMARAREFLAALSRAELSARLCDDREILDLLFCFFNPAQAAFERPAEASPAPMYTAKEVAERGLD